MSEAKNGSRTSHLASFGGFSDEGVASAQREPAVPSSPGASAPDAPELSEVRDAAGAVLNAVARTELLAFNIALLPQLKPTTLTLDVDGQACVFTNCKRHYLAALKRNVPSFVGGEYTLIGFASQNERLWAADFRRFVERKRAVPGWRLKYAEAVGKVFHLQPLTWTFGQLFERIDVRLIGAEIG